MDMTSTSFRLAHLLLAIEEAGSIVALCERVGFSPQYLSQLKNGTRGIGHRTARELERKLGYPEGAFDLPPKDDGTTLEAALHQLTPDARLQVIYSAIDDLSEDGAKAVARKLLERLALSDE